MQRRHMGEVGINGQGISKELSSMVYNWNVDCDLISVP